MPWQNMESDHYTSILHDNKGNKVISLLPWEFIIDFTEHDNYRSL